MREALGLKECNCEEWMRPACASLPTYERHNGKNYCVLHFPQKKNRAEFHKAISNKLALKDYNFSGVSFPPETYFNDYHFEKDAVFEGCIFEGEASFSRVSSTAQPVSPIPISSRS